MLLLIVVVSGLLVQPCLAPVTVPANPASGSEIASVVIHNDPIWRPSVVNTDPYTGEVLNSKSGYWVHNGSVEITIKNRPCTSYIDENGNDINTYYCIFYNIFGSAFGWLCVALNFGVNLPIASYQSNSDYTIISLEYGTESGWGFTGDVSFRVQTVEGGYFDYTNMVFEGVGGEWTEFTVTIPTHDSYGDANFSGSSKPDIRPTSVVPSTSNLNNPPLQNTLQQNLLQSNLFIILVFVCVIVVLLIVIAYLLCRLRKTRHVYVVGEIGSEVEM